jgi:hypothetical protein
VDRSRIAWRGRGQVVDRSWRGRGQVANSLWTGRREVAEVITLKTVNL